MNGIHLISTSNQSMNEFIQNVKRVHHNVDYIHLREKKWKTNVYVEAIQNLVEAGVSRQKIIVNDRVDIAVTEKVRGVQLPTNGLDPLTVKQYFPHVQIGCSVHSIAEGKEKEAAGADYLMFGHIFETTSKDNVPPQGLDQLEEFVGQMSIPVIAIGGIRPENINEIYETGAQGIAVLSGILLAKDVTEASVQYREKINEVR